MATTQVFPLPEIQDDDVLAQAVRRSMPLATRAGWWRCAWCPRVSKLIPALAQACGIMATVLSACNAILSFGVASSQSQAGGHIDDTSAAGF